MPPVFADPPDPNPKTPRLRCPAGAVDCHMHIFGPQALFPFVQTSKYISQDQLPETHIALQDTLGLSRGVLVSGGGYGRDTRHLEYTLERHGDRFVGVALLPEDVTPAHIRHLGQLGVKAVRFANPLHAPHLPPLSPSIAARCADEGWHVHYYPYKTELADVWQTLLELPCDVVLDHFAHIPAEGGTEQPAFQALLRLLDSGRFWVKLSGPMRITSEEPLYPNVTPLARALVAHRPDRMLWATDWPHINMNGRTMPNDGDLLDLLLDWAPEQEVRDRILADNPAKLFGLPAAG